MKRSDPNRFDLRYLMSHVVLPSVLAIAAIMVLTIRARGQCPGGVCPGGVCPLPQAEGNAETDYRWERIGATGWYALIQNGSQVGAWKPTTGEYRRYFRQTDSWSDPQPLPTDAPKKTPFSLTCDNCGCAEGCPCKAGSCDCKLGKPCCDACHCLLKDAGRQPTADSRKASQNFGLKLDKIGQKGERYEHCGRPVSKERACQALAGSGPIPNDAAKHSLTFIGGDDAARKAARAAADQAGLTGDKLVQDFPADNPLLKPGFVTRGTQTYLQTPAGKTLARTPSFSPTALAAVRKAHPDYDPQKDPDPAKAKAPAAGLDDLLTGVQNDLASVPSWVWLAGGVVFLLFLSRKDGIG